MKSIIEISGWTPEEFIELRKSKERSFHLQCQNILEMLRKHKSVLIFILSEFIQYFQGLAIFRTSKQRRCSRLL